MPHPIQILADNAAFSASEANTVYVFHNPATGALRICPYWEDATLPSQIKINAVRFAMAFTEDDGEGYQEVAVRRINPDSGEWEAVI